MFGKMGSLLGLLSNPGKLQEEMQKMQQSLGLLIAEGDAGAGMVRVRVNGRREVTACEISPEAMAGGDRELLEDLIKAATNQALQKIQGLIAEEAGKMAVNLGLPPGMLGMGGLPTGLF